MVKCEICNKKEAIWKRLRAKEGAIMHMCDPCLDKQPNKVELIDDYKYVG